MLLSFCCVESVNNNSEKVRQMNEGTSSERFVDDSLLSSVSGVSDSTPGFNRQGATLPSLFSPSVFEAATSFDSVDFMSKDKYNDRGEITSSETRFTCYKNNSDEKTGMLNRIINFFLVGIWQLFIGVASGFIAGRLI